MAVEGIEVARDDIARITQDREGELARGDRSLRPPAGVVLLHQFRAVAGRCQRPRIPGFVHGIIRAEYRCISRTGRGF